VGEQPKRPDHDPPQETTRGGFLGFVAHEMRNPLSTALWSAELLARLAPEERAGPRGDKLASMALRALQRLRFLIEDHFLAERLDIDGIRVRPESVVLREAIDALVAKAALADTVIDVADGLVVGADRGLLDRALDALLTVASRGHVPLRIEALRREADGMAVVTVAGATPAPDALAPPQKGTASDPSGRALALHMAVRVARALGGSLTISAGAYVLAIPLAAEEARPAAP
jgi:K+-sensing histidine kinase KdpD